MYSGKKAQYDFPKMRGGGIKGRLELFQKFIRFGIAALPLDQVLVQVSDLSPTHHSQISPPRSLSKELLGIFSSQTHSLIAFMCSRALCQSSQNGKANVKQADFNCSGCKKPAVF